jgi:hypothetical protein
VTDSYGRIHGFLDRSRYFSIKYSSSVVLRRLNGPRSRQLHFFLVVLEILLPERIAHSRSTFTLKADWTKKWKACQRRRPKAARNGSEVREVIQNVRPNISNLNCTAYILWYMRNPLNCGSKTDNASHLVNSS